MRPSVERAIEIGPYRQGDEKAINDAFNQVFGLSRSLQEWRWKFRPEEEACRIFLGRAGDGRILSHFGAQVVRLQLGGQERTVGHVCDIFCRRTRNTVPQRVYLRTARAFFERYGHVRDLPLVYGFPGDRSFRLGQLALGFQGDRVLKTYHKEVGSFLLPRWNRSYEVLEATRCSRKMLDGLWTRARHRYPVSVVRDSLWLNKRFDEHPLGCYETALACRDERCEAWAVMRLDNKARWVDLCWDGTSVQAVRVLARHMLKKARAHGHRAVDIVLEGDRAALDILLDMGWTEHFIQPMPTFSVVGFDPNISLEELVSSFYMTWGDTDID